MKIAVTLDPVFHLPLEPSDARLLQDLALHHYDWDCIAAGRVGGFIFGWVNMLCHGERADSVRATRRQMDLTLKVLELRGSGLLHGREEDRKRAGELSSILHVTLQHWHHRQPPGITIDTAVGFNLPRSANHG